jgi:hypothetical protein
MQCASFVNDKEKWPSNERKFADKYFFVEAMKFNDIIIIINSKFTCSMMRHYKVIT